MTTLMSKSRFLPNGGLLPSRILLSSLPLAASAGRKRILARGEPDRVVAVLSDTSNGDALRGAGCGANFLSTGSDAMGKSVQQPAAFDSMAEGYDAEFTTSALGRVLRPMVWDRFTARFAAGSSLLELGCGTGEDAIHLAKSGHHVLATDASSRMIDRARLKAEAAGVADRIRFRVVPMESLSAALGDEIFDGVYSNFGAVNCAPDLPALASLLAPRLAPNAPLVWVVMGRYVPWEMGWYLLRGDARRAFRRLRRAGSEWRGMTIHYPTPGDCARLLEPHFVLDVARPLGLVLPPSYAAGWLERAPRVQAWMARVERALFERARGAGLGDHYVLEARRAA
jgi:SAM-dependent methyltransferase